MYGSVPGVPVGARFRTRASLYASGVHRDVGRHICGGSSHRLGAESVVIEARDEYPVDLGNVVYLIGAGPLDRSGKVSGDQEFTGANSRLVRNVASGQPVRAIRVIDGEYEYSGLWIVEDAFTRMSRTGYRLCTFRIRSENGDAIEEEVDAARSMGTEAVARRITTHYRLVRNSAVPERVKALYDYSCQICGIRIETSFGPYSEGAHLVPLGGVAAGPDATENLLCLCPNHHVMLDHGAIYLTDDWIVRDRHGHPLGQLTIHPSHQLDVKYARRHRALMGFEIR
jgi:putative restriction endonuclease